MISDTNTYRIRESYNTHSSYKNEYKLNDFYRSSLIDFFVVKHNIVNSFPGQKEDEFCLKVSKIETAGIVDFQIETSYYVGAQWLIKDKLPLVVYPKFNTGSIDSLKNVKEVNYIKLMVEALQSSESLEHLSDLVYIDFNQNQLEIEQKDDLLSPLLIIQFLNLLKLIVKKGLKLSYYKKRSNLHSKIRGKILVSDTVKHNHAKHKMLNTYCSYDEFGVDHFENRLLKKALNFSINYLSPLKNTGSDFNELDEMVRFIKPAFQNISEEININTVKHFRPNPIFKEYSQALKIAQLLLKRFGYNISSTTKDKIKTPPFWIDMSKLFELYVLSLLRNRFPKKEEILYQPKVNYLYPDYILNSTKNDCQMIVDAKYKNYGDTKIKTEDIRQVTGYARLEEVYNIFERDSNNNSNIDCLIIYPSLNSDNDISDLKKNKLREYRGIYKIAVKLPTIA